ncbi:MAG TPA: hypothetical protein VK468_05760 [Pyrinomonadaceae bacterium]|nr:hypothetical protein [Pyrinomonadaceae bacterium]
MANLIDEFVQFTNALQHLGIDYAVCGGWAMAIHGLPRATIDIDLLILSDDLERVWQTANGQGYDVEGLPLHFADGAIEIRRISKIDEVTKRLFTLDLLLVTEELTDVWEERQIIEWEDGKTSVVSKEGLIKMKMISDREQDRLDIEKLREVDDAR